jgi:membrane protein YdbS with pleckstrin-like domain
MYFNYQENADMDNKDNKNQAPYLPDMRYPSKRDLWLSILLLGLSILFFYMSVMIYFEPVSIWVKIGGSIFFLVFAIYMPIILYGISYTLTSDQLIIKCAFLFSSTIPLNRITEVFPTHNPLSSPACSLDRLRIKYTGHWFGALISPNDKQVFMEDLLQRCPQLVRENDRLILKLYE